jgi:hypothetical protein
VEFETTFHTGLQRLRRRKKERKKFYYLVVIFDAHTERVDEDGQQNSLLEVLVFDYGFDDPTDTLEAGETTSGHPRPRQPVTVTPMVHLGSPSPLPYHGPVTAAGLLTATVLCLRAVAPPVGCTLFVSQAVHT